MIVNALHFITCQNLLNLLNPLICLVLCHRLSNSHQILNKNYNAQKHLTVKVSSIKSNFHTSICFNANLSRETQTLKIKQSAFVLENK